MQPSTEPLAVLADQFEDLSCELFQRFRQTAKLRLATGENTRIIVLEQEQGLPMRRLPECQPTDKPALLLH